MNPDPSTTKARPAQRRPANLLHARVWFITAADSPIGTAVARQALQKGDIVVAGALSVKFGQEHHAWRSDFEEFVEETNNKTNSKGLLTVVGVNARLKEDCQAAVAEAVKRHGRLDILFICNSEALLGTLPELTATPSTRSAIPALFSTNLFSPVNLILATLPHFRSRSSNPAAALPAANEFPNPVSTTSASSRTASLSGHHATASAAVTPASATAPTPTLFTSPTTLTHPTLASPRPRIPPTPITPKSASTSCGPHILLHSTTAAHLGTPGLAAYCASQRAIEGYCDSLAYEVAPFGVRVTVVQSPLEVGVLAGGGVKVVPRLKEVVLKKEYSGRKGSRAIKKEENCGDVTEEAHTDETDAPFARGAFARILASLPGSNLDPALEASSSSEASETTKTQAKGPIKALPQLPNEMTQNLLAETVQAILAIAGHTNPPARHIVGLESVGLVKEKLRGVSEELEEFLGCSGAVDL